MQVGSWVRHRVSGEIGMVETTHRFTGDERHAVTVTTGIGRRHDCAPETLEEITEEEALRAKADAVVAGEASRG